MDGLTNSLRSITIYKNPLIELPEFIGEIRALKNLTLLETNITSLPESLLNLKNLKTLQLARTPIAKKADKTTKGILKTLKKNGVQVFTM